MLDIEDNVKASTITMDNRQPFAFGGNTNRKASNGVRWPDQESSNDPIFETIAKTEMETATRSRDLKKVMVHKRYPSNQIKSIIKKSNTMNGSSEKFHQMSESNLVDNADSLTKDLIQKERQELEKISQPEEENMFHPNFNDNGDELATDKAPILQQDKNLKVEEISMDGVSQDLSVKPRSHENFGDHHEKDFDNSNQDKMIKGT